MCWSRWEKLQGDFVNSVFMVILLLTDSSDRAVRVIYLRLVLWGQVLSGWFGRLSSGLPFFPCLLVSLSRLFPTLQITGKASASLKYWPLYVRWRLVTGTWWPSQSVAAMEAEAGAPTVSSAPCPGPLSTRRCVLWDLGTPLMAEVSYLLQLMTVIVSEMKGIQLTLVYFQIHRLNLKL